MPKIVSNDWEIKNGPIYYLRSLGKNKRIGKYVKNGYENSMFGIPVLKYDFMDEDGKKTRVPANDIKNGNLLYDDDLLDSFEENVIPTQDMLNDNYGTAGKINPYTGRQLEYGGKAKKSKKYNKSKKSKKSNKSNKSKKTRKHKK
jgi:hypothetical protein